jgi:hypothetical protein
MEFDLGQERTRLIFGLRNAAPVYHSATRPTPILGGWHRQPCGISPLIQPVPTLLDIHSVARLAPMLGGWARQGTRRTFSSSSSSRAWGLGTNGHSAYFRRLVWLPCLGLGAGNNSAYHCAETEEFISC